MSVAAACALLGLKLWERGEPPGREGPWVQEARDGRLRVIFDHSLTRQREYNVSRAAFDLAALLELRGVQAIDVSPCLLCGGTKWDDGEDYYPPGPCLECTIDGKPTGRRRVPAFEAVLMGEPRTCRRCDDGWLRQERMWATMEQSERMEPDPDDETALRTQCPACKGSRREPGHASARAVLRQLADGWEQLAESMPERSAEVMLDRAEAKGDASARGLLFAYPHGGQPYAAPCPELGAWVLAWLAGEIECEPCARATPGGPSVRGCPHPHPGTRRVAVDAHLATIRAHLAEAWQGATVECGKCKGDGHTSFTLNIWGGRTPNPCQGCAGLGRVKPQPEAA